MGATGGFAVMGMSTAANTYAQSQALEAQGNFQKTMFDFNASMADLQGKDAIERGDKAAGAVRKRAKQVVGSQRAALAAQGVEVNADSAADVQADTKAIATEDALTIQNNAWREAWGYKVSANDMRLQGWMGQHAASGAARNTLYSGSMQTASYGLQGYSSYKKENG